MLWQGKAYFLVNVYYFCLIHKKRDMWKGMSDIKGIFKHNEKTLMLLERTMKGMGLFLKSIELRIL